MYYLGSECKFSPHFLHFSFDLDKIRAHKYLINKCKFLANRRSIVALNLGAQINFYPYLAHVLSDLDEIRYQRSAAYVSFVKIEAGKPYFSYGLE
jgi:hypothetical protein